MYLTLDTVVHTENSPEVSGKFLLYLDAASLNDGELYSAYLSVYDWAEDGRPIAAGNESAPFLLGSFVVDRSAPELGAPSASLGDEQSTSGEIFLSETGLNSVNISCSAEDLQSGIRRVLYGAQELGGSDEIVWTSSIGGLSLIAGRKYRFGVKAENCAGICAIAFAPQVFLYDPTAPVLERLSISPSGPYACGAVMRVEVTAHENESAILRYELSLGTANDPGALSRLLSPVEILSTGLTPDSVGRLVLISASSKAVFRCVIPELPESGPLEYIATVRAYNGGGPSAPLSKTFSLSAGPGITVATAGDYTASLESLEASWSPVNYDGGLSGYRCEVFETESGAINGESVTLSQSVLRHRFEGLSLKNGEVYAVRVTGLLDGQEMLGGESEDIRVDTSGPLFCGDKGPRVPRYVTPEGIPFEWEAQDGESGIASTELSLFDYLPKTIEASRFEPLLTGSDVSEGAFDPTRCYQKDADVYRLKEGLESCDKTQLRGFFMSRGIKNSRSGGGVTVAASEGPQSLFLCTTSSGTMLDLSAEDVLYAELRIVNGAGIPSVWESGAIMVDATAPPVPAVWASSAFYNTVQPLEAAWQPSFDSGSGIRSFSWTLVSDPDELSLIAEEEWAVIWEDGDTVVPETTLTAVNPGEHGAIRYFAVRSVNGAGEESIGLSEAVILDASAPYVPVIRIQQALEGAANGYREISFLSSFDELSLFIQAYDPESGISSLSYDWGTDPLLSGVPENRVPDEFIVREGSTALARLFFRPVDFSETPLSGSVDTPTVFRVLAENAAGGKSVVRGPSLVYDPEIPVLSSPYGIVSFSGNAEPQGGDFSYIPDRLSFSWELSSGTAPVLYYQVSLEKTASDGTVTMLVNQLTIGQNTSYEYFFDVGSPAGIDALYTLSVTAYTAAGRTVSAVSNTVAVISSLPEADFIRVPEFVDCAMSPADGSVSLEVSLNACSVSLFADRPALLPRVSEYEYCVGSPSSETAYSGGRWNRVQVDVPLTSLSLLLNADTGPAPDRSEIVVKLRVKNSFGLWSREEVSGIMVDHSDPVISSLSINRAYTNAPDFLDGVSFSINEDYSGLRAYRIGITGAASGERVNWSEAGSYVLVPADDPYALSREAYSVSGDALSEAVSYRVALKVQNKAGTWSEISYSSPVMVDRTPPVLSYHLRNEDSQSYEDNTGATVYVINSPLFVIPFTVTDTLCPDGAEVSYSFQDGGASGIQYYSGSTPEAVSAAVVHYVPPEGFSYGRYRVTATACNAAGNSAEYALELRYNSPPEFTLPINLDSLFGDQVLLHSVPGKEVGLCANTVTDPEGDTPLEYRWSFGDGTADSSVPQPFHTFNQDGTLSRSLYTVSLTVSNAWGAHHSESALVAVELSSGGTLHSDELWSGQHSLSADVTVPPGLTLTILPGTIITVADGKALEVEGSLVIQGNAEAGVNFTDSTGAAFTGWKGIFLASGADADVSYATFTHAERALALETGASLSVSHSAFMENRVGLHACGETASVSDCVFTANEWYAIKEDAISENGTDRPVVTGCIFNANGYDYYHSTKRILDAGTLNTVIDANSGNRDE